MNREQINHSLQKIAEEEIPPDSIHLWSSVRQSLVAKRQNHFEQGESQMKESRKLHVRLTWTVALSLTILALGIFFLATPPGKVLAQEIVNFFTRNSSNEQTIPPITATQELQPEDLAASPVTGQTVLDEGCGTAIAPRCNLEEVQAGTSFEIKDFASAPEGMTFSGATMISDGVLLNFTGDYGELLLIEEISSPNVSETWTVGKEATIQSTTVYQYLAEFVQGAWSSQGINRDILVWDESMPGRTLRWQADDIQFTLINFPMRGANGPIGYDMIQLRQIAEGLQTESDASASTLPGERLSLQDAEAKAGFDFNESSWLPAGLALYQTTYDSKHNSICQYYRGYGDDPAFPPLVIAQSTWALPPLEELQTKAYYNGKQITLGLAQEDWSISGSNGSAGKFFETGIQIDALCGGEPSTTNRVLLWQQNNRTFALFARLDSFSGGAFVSKLELQRMAAALNGATPQADASALDPERLLSLKDAETFTGYGIQQPAMMLADVHFDHISAGILQGSPNRVVTEYLSNERLINGTTRLLVFQTPKSTSSLDEQRLAGGYGDVTVKGNPAIYQAQCSETAPYGTFCFQILTWFEGDTQFDIATYFPALVSKETIIAIADSMR